MEVFTVRFGKAAEFLKTALVTSHASGVDVSFQKLFDEFRFVGFYFYNDRSVLCQSFNECLCNFIANEAEVRKAVPVESQSEEAKSFLAIVCVFPDEDKSAFQQALAKVPWYVLEHHESTARVKLLRMFRVRRVPCFVLLETSQLVVCSTDCCTEIQEDPLGREFPWKPKPLADVFIGDLLSRDGKKVTFESLPKGYKGILFAAQWCPPCRTFVQKLKDVYRRLNASSETFEIIFCSRDRSVEAFERFYSTMPWLAVPYGDPRLQLIAKSLHVQEIPSFLILDEDLGLLNRYGKLEVLLDPLAREFPWHPRSVIELSERTLSRLKEDVAMILFAEGSAEDLTFAQTVLLSIAEEHFQESKEPEIIFFYAAEDLVNERILEGFGLSDSPLPLVCISDPFSESIYVCDHPSVSEDIIRQFLVKFKRNQLTPKPYRRAKLTGQSFR